MGRVREAEGTGLSTQNINVKDYSIFGSECRTPDVLSNNGSAISEREEDMVRVDDDEQ